MKCGHCKQDHQTLQEVKDCAALGPTPSQASFAEAVKANTPEIVPISGPQLGFLKVLVEERPAWARDNGLHVDELHTLSRSEASDWIGEAKAQPKECKSSSSFSPIPPELSAVVPDGYYAVTSATGNNDLDFFRVKRKGDRLYVDRVIGGRPDYGLRMKEFAGVLARIRDAGPDESRQLYAREIGNCYICNRHLTDEESRRLGIGPVCRAG